MNNQEIVNDLLGFKGLKIIQRKDMFNFSLDSVLLADFVIVTKKVKEIIDLGTGFGPVPLFLSTKTQAKIVGVEIQEAVYDIAEKNRIINKLDNQINFYNIDINQIEKHFKPGSFDIVTSNPPFFKYSKTSNINAIEYKTIARHEVTINLETLIQKAKYLLDNRGHFYLVHRAERLEEIIHYLNTYDFTIKRLRFVYPKPNTNALIVLIDAIYQGAHGMHVLEPLIIHQENGTYTKETQMIFNNERR